MSTHKSEIKVTVNLDDNKVPEAMTWEAKDGGVNPTPTKASIISVWDEKNHEMLKIDLWTKDMPLDQMKKFLHQNIVGLADTMEKAANLGDAAQELRDFALQLGQKHGILKKP